MPISNVFKQGSRSIPSHPLTKGSVHAAVRAVIDRLETRTHLTAVASIDFDYGVSPHAIRVTFDGPISATSLSTADLFVRKVGSDESRIATTSFSSSVNTANTVATFTYSAGYFPDGDYLVDLFKGDVLDAANQPLSVDASSSFFFLYADLSGPSGTRDRVVNSKDALYVQSKIGTANPTYGDGDVDEDGAVTIDDILFVADYYDTELATPVNGLDALTASPANGTNVRLTWARKSTTNTGFRIQRSTDGGRTFTQIVSSLAATSETYVDTTANLSTTGYIYRVRSIEPNQPFSSIARLSRYFNASIAQNATEGGSPVAPPTNLTVTSVGKNSVTLGWTDSSTEESAFEVYRSDDGGITYRSVQYLPIANATSWTDTGIKAEKEYFYAVRSRSDTQTSNFSDVTSGTTLAGAPTVIRANVPAGGLPHEIVAEFDQPIVKNVGTLSDAQVAIYSLTGGRQLIGGANGEFTVVDSVSGEIIRATLNGALSGTGILANGNYEITIRGDAIKNAAGQTLSDAEHPDLEGVADTFFLRGDFNRDRSISFDDLLILAQNYGLPNRTHAQGDTNFDGLVDFDDLLYLTQHYQSALPAPLTSVSQLSATTAVFDNPDFDPQHRANASNAAYLEWSAPSDLEGTFDGYMVWRSIDSVHFGDPIATLPITQLNLIDRDLTQGERYTYRVRPYRTVGASIEYGTSTNKVGVVPTLPGPTNVTVESSDSDTLEVNWTDNATNEHGYHVLVFDANDTLVKTVDVGANATSATVTGLNEFTTYSVRVSAWTPSAINHAIVAGTTRLAAPTEVVWQQLSESSYHLTWTDNSSHETGYTIRWFADSEFEDAEEETIEAGAFVGTQSIVAGAGTGLTLSFDITNLPTDADLLFDVTAESGNESTISLTTGSISTLARVAPPQAVSLVKASPLNSVNKPATDLDPYKIQSDRLLINWNDSQSNVSHYYVWMTQPQRALLGVVKANLSKLTAGVEQSTSSQYQSGTQIPTYSRLPVGPSAPAATVSRAGYQFVATALDPMQSYTFAVQPEFYDTEPVDEKASNSATTGFQNNGEYVGLWVEEIHSAKVALRWSPIDKGDARVELFQQNYLKSPSNPPPNGAFTWVKDGEPTSRGMFGGSSTRTRLSGLRSEWQYTFILRVTYHGDRYVDQSITITTLADSEEESDEREESENHRDAMLALTSDAAKWEYAVVNGISLVYESSRGLGWYRFPYQNPFWSRYEAPDVETLDVAETHNWRYRFVNEYVDAVIIQDSETRPAANVVNATPSPRNYKLITKRNTINPELTVVTFSVLEPFPDAPDGMKGYADAYWDETWLEGTYRLFFAGNALSAGSMSWPYSGFSLDALPGSTFRWTEKSYGPVPEGSDTSENRRAIVEVYTAPEYQFEGDDRLNNDDDGDDGGAEADAPEDDHDDDDDSNDEEHSPRPSGLEITETTDNSVTLALRDNATNEQGIEIERSRDGIHWARVTVLRNRTPNSSRDVEIMDSNLAPGVEYSYRARAFKWTKTNKKADESIEGPVTDSNRLYALEFTRWSTTEDGTTDPRVGIWAETPLVREGQTEHAIFGIYRVGEEPQASEAVGLQIRDIANRADYLADYKFLDGSGLPAAAPVTPPINFTFNQQDTIQELRVDVNFPDSVGELNEVIPLEVRTQTTADHTYERDPTLASPAKIEIWDFYVDLDVDSDNTSQLDPAARTVAEEDIEATNRGSKLVPVSADDSDGDEIPDFADGFNAFTDITHDNTSSAELVPVFLEVPPTALNASITFSYSYSDPSAVSRERVDIDGLDGVSYDTFDYSVPAGHLRIWKKSGTAGRRIADAIAPGTAIAVNTLFPSGQRIVELWVEVVRGSESPLAISAEISLAGGDLVKSDEIKILAFDPVVGLSSAYFTEPETSLAGFSILQAGDSAALTGGSGRNIILADDTVTYIHGGGGDDIIVANGSTGTLNGGPGTDLLFLWNGTREVYVDSLDQLSFNAARSSAVAPLSHRTSSHALYEAGGGGGEATFDTRRQFTGDEILAAYRWTYGSDDLWLDAFLEGNGKVQAVAGDGIPFSQWDVEWIRGGDGGFDNAWVGYVVEIQYDIGSVLDAAQALRKAILTEIAFYEHGNFHDHITSQWSNYKLNPQQWGQLFSDWQSIRSAQVEYVQATTELVAGLYYDGMAAVAGVGGEIADVVINFDDYTDFAVSTASAAVSLLWSLPGRVRDWAADDNSNDSEPLLDNLAAALGGSGGSGSSTEAAFKPRAYVNLGAMFPSIRQYRDVLRPLFGGTNMPVGFVARNDAAFNPRFYQKHGRTTVILGTAQETGDDGAEHAATINHWAHKIIDDNPQKKYLYLGMNRSARTMLDSGDSANRLMNSAVARKRPDIFAVYLDANNQVKVEMFEVPSAGQEKPELVAELMKIWNELPATYRGPQPNVIDSIIDRGTR